MFDKSIEACHRDTESLEFRTNVHAAYQYISQPADLSTESTLAAAEHAADPAAANRSGKSRQATTRATRQQFDETIEVTFIARAETYERV